MTITEISANGCFKISANLNIGVEFGIICPFPPFHVVPWKVSKIGRKYIYAQNINNAQMRLVPLGNGWYNTKLPSWI